MNHKSKFAKEFKFLTSSKIKKVNYLRSRELNLIPITATYEEIIELSKYIKHINWLYNNYSVY